MPDPRHPVVLCLLLGLVAVPGRAWAALPPRPPGADTVATAAGRVILAGTEEAVAGAEVVGLGGAVRSRTGPDGRFALEGLAPGPTLLAARHPDGMRGVAAVTLAPGANRDLVITVRREPVRLPDLEVEVRSAPGAGGRTAGFSGRRSRRSGSFLDRGEIEARAPLRTKDLFRRIPGVRVERHRWYHGLERIVLDRVAPSLQQPCPVQLYVDGIRISSVRRFGYRRLDLDLPGPDEIEALEVYAGAARVPARFAGHDARCGVVAFWTRDPTGG